MLRGPKIIVNLLLILLWGGCDDVGLRLEPKPWVFRPALPVRELSCGIEIHISAHFCASVRPRARSPVG